jgi:hypothetical protein
MRFRAWPLSMRLHRSTYVVAGLIAVVLLLASIPGTLVLRGMHIAHGWPWTFLARGFDETTAMNFYSQVIDGPRSDHCLSSLPQTVFWGLRDNVEYRSYWLLLADVVVGVCIVVFGAAAFEVWRRRRSRIFQFYLGELFAVVTLAAICLSWLTVETRERSEEQQALADMGTYEYGKSLGSVTHKDSLAGPHWLRRLVGDAPFRAFDRVESVTCMSTSDEYPELRLRNPEELSHLRHLREAFIGRVGEPRPKVSYLSRPDRIESLAMSACDEEELLQLSRFTNLRTLEIGFGAPHVFSDRSMAVLSKLPSLKRLILVPQDQETVEPVRGVDNAWLSHVGDLKGIEGLVIESNRITDAGLRHISSLRNLDFLILRGTGISDSCIDYLTGLDKLDELNIVETQVTETGIAKLKKLTGLRRLCLPPGMADSRAVKDLKLALPQCKIVSGSL